MHACPAEKKARAPSNLNRMVAYRFGQPRPGQAADLGRPGQRPPLRPVSLFFWQGDFSFLQNDCKIQKFVENVLCIQKL
jgi:hypothetical protein